MHKRAGAQATSTNGTNGVTTVAHGGATNGGIPPMPATKQRRRKKRKQKPSHMVEEWMAVILGVLIVLMCGYWVMTKLWTASLILSGHGGDDTSGGGDESDPDHKHNGHHHREGKSPMDNMKPMDFNSIYHIPESHKLVGDRSDKYAKLRKHYDNEVLPKDSARSLAFVQSLREQQAANEYDVVPIVEYQSHGSLHQGHEHHRHGHQRRTNEEKREEEEEEKSEAKLMKDEVYDIYNCPDDPVDGYPYAWPILTVLDNWSPDDTTVPDAIYQGLCVFDYQKDYDKAETYRNKEVPFIVQNDPEVARTVERWNAPGYMDALLKGVKHRTEYSHNNHFMYALPPKTKKGKNKKGHMFDKTPKNYVPPTEMMRMPYAEWLEHANITAEDHTRRSKSGSGDDQEGDDVASPDKDHWYFRLIGCGLTGQDGSCDKGSSEYLFDELPWFQPVDNLYLSNGAQQKGIHCRFGMKGVIAENHFDGSRNSIALLGGSRRYILSHPDQCTFLFFAFIWFCVIYLFDRLCSFTSI